MGRRPPVKLDGIDGSGVLNRPLEGVKSRIKVFVHLIEILRPLPGALSLATIDCLDFHGTDSLPIGQPCRAPGKAIDSQNDIWRLIECEENLPILVTASPRGPAGGAVREQDGLVR